MKHFVLNDFFKRLAITTAGVIVAQSAGAKETVTLKFADWFPLSHHVISEGGQVFMDKAVELSNGKIEFKFYPAEQLGKAKDSLQLAQSGVADIVNIAPAYITDKFPLSGVVELPGIYEGACNGTYALAKLAQPGNVLYENELKPNGVRVLFTAAVGAYRIMTANKKIEKGSEYAGLKLRTAGGAMDQTAASIGAVSIRMAGPDVLVSLSRGTLDGLFWPLQSVKPFGLASSLKYWTPNVSVGSFSVYYAISEKAWSKLSPDVQQVLTDAGEYATKAHCEYIDRSEILTIEELKGQGVQPVPIPDADAKALNQGYTKIYENWADALDKRKRPGNEVLKAFRASIDQ